VECIELDIAVLCTSGVPGPRLPFEAQYTGLVDEVCWFFPELRFVLRHGCEPWTDLAVKLLLKWPNLYYSTSAFAPKHYPKEIVEFANARGADKIIYAGYYPLGLTLERIFRELEDVPFKDHVWPKFLRENALTALKLSWSRQTGRDRVRGARARGNGSTRAGRSSAPGVRPPYGCRSSRFSDDAGQRADQAWRATTSGSHAARCTRLGPSLTPRRPPSVSSNATRSQAPTAPAIPTSRRDA
jgi:hypothetical protein